MPDDKDIVCCTDKFHIGGLVFNQACKQKTKYFHGISPEQQFLSRLTDQKIM